MAHIEANRPLLASVLDRLIDLEPQVRSEAKLQSTHVLRDLRAAVRRDLEALLNTRRRCVQWPVELEELGRSIVGYGTPDPSSLEFSREQGRERFLVELKTLIETFEPRLTRVRVEAVAPDSGKEHVLTFRIDAVLNAETDPEAIRFMSRLEPVRRSFEVRL